MLLVMVGYFLPIALNTKLEHASTWVWKQWNKSFSEYFLQQYWSWSRVSANEMFCRGPVCYPNGLKFVWTIGLCIKLYNRPGIDVLHEDISFCALRNILMWQNRFKGPFFPTPLIGRYFLSTTFRAAMFWFKHFGILPEAGVWPGQL